MAGFKEVKLLPEPIAAALAYAQMQRKLLSKYILTYDLGGGTFDLALLEHHDGWFHPVLEPQGLPRCGGDDFDEALYNDCNSIAEKQLHRPITQNGKRDLQFLNKCRQWKETLTNSERRLFKHYLEPGGVLFQHEITREKFKSLIRDKVEDTVQKTRMYLEQANAEGHQVDMILLIGGSTHIPFVQEMLNESLPLRPQVWEHNEMAVALGAAYHAHNHWKPESQYREKVRQVWTEQQPDQQNIKFLSAIAKELDLNKDQIAAIEREVMGRTKEEIYQSYSLLIVSKQKGGQYRTISEAIKAAKANMRILVRPGTYSEAIVIDKPIEIVGDGVKEQIIIESSDADCILMQTTNATIQGLTLRCKAGQKNKKYYAIDIPQGQLTLVECDISSDSLACIAIHGATARPVIQRCTIHQGNASGILVYDHGQGIIDSCEIFGTTSSGLQIRDGGNPTVQRCRIHDGKAGGIFVYRNGLGTIENCEIFHNQKTGVEISEGGNPSLRHCRIYGNGNEAVWVHNNGSGAIEYCDLTGNKRAWDIGWGSTVRRISNKE